MDGMDGPRAVAHCILRREERVLLIRIEDPATGQTGWRAPGGGIEWLETSEQAVRREIREELGVELEVVKPRGVVEGFITWRGRDEHEVVFVFEGRPSDWGHLGESDHMRGVEASGRVLDLHWVDAADLYARGEAMYPEGLWPHLLGHLTQRVRPTALCALERNGAVLAFDLWDAINQRRLVRLPGGGIEYGERAVEAVRREMREELDTELADLELLGVLENIFGFQGQPGHETVWVYRARAENGAIYARHDNVAREEHENVPLRWVPFEELLSGGTTLVPEGTLELLLAR